MIHHNLNQPLTHLTKIAIFGPDEASIFNESQQSASKTSPMCLRHANHSKARLSSLCKLTHAAVCCPAIESY